MPTTITGGITEGEVPERTKRPYASIMPLSEQPGCGGLKRTNHGEYISSEFEIRVVSATTFEELDAQDVKVIDDAVRYAVLNVPAPTIFIALFPRQILFYFEDKYHKAILGYEAWTSKPAAYSRV